jgi:hypothetical protein
MNALKAVVQLYKLNATPYLVELAKSIIQELNNVLDSAIEPEIKESVSSIITRAMKMMEIFSEGSKTHEQ